MLVLSQCEWGLSSLLFFLGCCSGPLQPAETFKCRNSHTCTPTLQPKSLFWAILALKASPTSFLLYCPDYTIANYPSFLCNWKDELWMGPLEHRASIRWAKAQPFSRISKPSHLQPRTLENAAVKEWGSADLKRTGHLSLISTKVREDIFAVKRKLIAHYKLAGLSLFLHCSQRRNQRFTEGGASLLLSPVSAHLSRVSTLLKIHNSFFFPLWLVASVVEESSLIRRSLYSSACRLL